MRQIKFRGKSNKDGEWFFGNLYDKDISGRTYICTTKKGCLDIDPDTVGQFIGLHDKNGKEIYEGDILKGYWNTLLVVYFDKDYLQYRVKNTDGNNREISYYGNNMTLEVIGNIHDNPELLKGGQNE